MNAMTDVAPWYRQLWPWLLISIPGVAVIAGMFMLYLAIEGADSLVVDDYYKQGKAINQQIARDEQAAQMHLLARVRADAAGTTLRIEGDGFKSPAVLQGRIVHIARAELDQPLQFSRTADGNYLSSVKLPEQGWWRLHIEDPAGRWRLVSHKWEAGSSDEIMLEYRTYTEAGQTR